MFIPINYPCFLRLFAVFVFSIVAFVPALKTNLRYAADRAGSLALPWAPNLQSSDYSTFTHVRIEHSTFSP